MLNKYTQTLTFLTVTQLGCYSNENREPRVRVCAMIRIKSAINKARRTLVEHVSHIRLSDFVSELSEQRVEQKRSIDVWLTVHWVRLHHHFRPTTTLCHVLEQLPHTHTHKLISKLQSIGGIQRCRMLQWTVLWLSVFLFLFALMSIFCCLSFIICLLIGGVAQWLERRSKWRTFPDLRLIYDWHVTTLWVRCPLWVNQPGQLSFPSLQGR